MPATQQTLTDGSIIVELADLDDWDQFKWDNEDELLSRYGSFARAYRALTDGGLNLGGGASPEIAVYFVD